MPPVIPLPIQVKLQNNVVSTVPYRITVQQDAGGVVVLTWKATVPGTEFPEGVVGEPPYFEWKDDSTRPIPDRTDNRTLVLTYNSPTNEELWEYTIWLRVIGSSSPAIGQDPEVDNTRPPGTTHPGGGGQGGGGQQGGGRVGRPPGPPPTA